MWKNLYKDYKPDDSFIHERLEQGKEIVGCQMHETNGWQDSLHKEQKKRRKGLLGLIKRILKK